MVERVVNFRKPGPLREPEPDLNAPDLSMMQTLGQRRHLICELDSFMVGYPTLEEYTEAWQKFGPGIMDEWRNRVGIRPAGYWVCDFQGILGDAVEGREVFGKLVPSPDDQLSILAANDLLSDYELTALGKSAGTIDD
jgi:hypothetical protein